MVDAAPGNRSLLLLNFRPEYHAQWMQRSYYQQPPLLPLGPEAIKELLADLLGTDPSLHRLTERVEERTGGNPFFIEEIAQSLSRRSSFSSVVVAPATASRMPLSSSTASRAGRPRSRSFSRSMGKEWQGYRWISL
jgi:hypothetical protein